MVRHPAAFAFSLRRLNWDPLDVLEDLKKQSALLENHLGEDLDVDVQSMTFTERSALTWKCIYKSPIPVCGSQRGNDRDPA